MMPLRAVLPVVLSVLLAAPAGAAGAKARGLAAFDSCAELVGYARQHAVRALRTGWGPAAMDAPVVGAPVPGTTKDGARPESAAGEVGAFSDTNLQEAGVDEPDVVKTDGATVFAVANGTLHAVDVTGRAPFLRDVMKLDEGYGHELLLHGDRLLVVQSAWLEAEDGGRPVVRLTEVDVADPSKLRVLRTERNDGEYVSARRTGSTARVVIAARAPVMHAVAETTAPSGRALVGRRLRQVRRARLAAWRPHTLFRDARRPARTRFGPLTRCDEVRHAARFSGLDTVTILAVDLDRGLPSADADAVMSDAQIVYGSPEQLYVATQRWLPPRALRRREAPEVSTHIHRFAATQEGRTTYAASGAVDGFLLNQFSLSEHEGVLRVAATEEPEWWNGREDAGVGSAVVTLDAATMTRHGRVGGLGKGERIFAVRFLGDVGYVVTFRQTDPLYTLDLSDPAAPRVTGELKIPGYSAYLHPVADGLLLGIGQDADAEGRTLGTQLSLFDVSDPAAPARIAQHTVPNGWSAAEHDHHAFLWWAPGSLAVVPLQTYDEAGGSFVGAAGFRVTSEGIEEVGRVEHPRDPELPDTPWEILRALVVGDRVLTVSPAGLMASPLSSLAEGPFAAFPSRPSAEDVGGCGPSSSCVVGR